VKGSQQRLFLPRLAPAERAARCSAPARAGNDYKAVNFRGIVSTKANEIATAKEDRDYADMEGDVTSVTMFANSAVAQVSYMLMKR
jgi:hypothetical protein